MSLLQEKVGSAVVLIGDKVEPRGYLQNLVALLGRENEELPEENRVVYVVARNYADLARALKQTRERIRLVLMGPGLEGNPEMIGRMLGRSMRTILVLDPERRPLARDPELAKKLEENLVEIGIRVVRPDEADAEFYEPIVKEVVTGLSAQMEIGDLSPEERSELLEKRLESVTKFPSLPETQQKISALNDDSPPKKWAEAIDPDIPVRNVILQSLNSAHYGFRYPVKTIEQAVSLATTRTVRELVLGCTVQRLFRKVPEARVEQFWQHSAATAIFARLFLLPAIPEEQDPQQKVELERFDFEEAETRLLAETGLWRKFDLERDVDPFTAGLLHDLGKVSMALCFEESLLLVDPMVANGVEEAEAKGEIWAEPVRNLERGIMHDADHQTIGARVAKRWGLAPWILQTIAKHHDVDRKSPDLLKVVALADLAANTLFSYPYPDGTHGLQKLHQKTREAASGADDLSAVFEGLAGDYEKVLTALEVPDHLWKLIELTKFFEVCYAVAPRVKDYVARFLQMTKG